MYKKIFRSARKIFLSVAEAFQRQLHGKTKAVNKGVFRVLIVELSTIVNSEFIHYAIILSQIVKRVAKMNYYQRLRDVREDRDLSQKDVADYLGISQSDYSKYELGKHMMGIDKYIKLAHFYNVSIDYLSGAVDTIRPLESK